MVARPPHPAATRWPIPSAARTPAWLVDAVFYQVYLQSFVDSNGDGIGDLPGLISKLDYIRSLGCNAIWLNPCFVSPFQDAGYDIADFYQVAPRYGTNEDLRRLFDEARDRGIRVCLDLVAGHTSIEHPWFKHSAEPTPNRYTNWYIWTHNWWDDTGDLQSIGGYSDRNGKYITNYFPFQPALNYGFAVCDPARPWQLPCDHPDVRALRQEMLNVIRFWLKLGASGFRADMANSLVKGDPEQTAVGDFWREVRGMMDREFPDSVLISEWGSPPKAIAAGFHVDFMLPFLHENRRLFSGSEHRGVVDYSQAFFGPLGRGDASGYFDRYLGFLRQVEGRGYISIPSGNHDTERLNFQRDTRDLEIIFAFIMTMPGVPFVYYGDEIGMRQIQPIRSKEGGYNRTSARTPMQWTAGKNAGFSDVEASKLYLPIDPAEDRPTVAAQEPDPDSLLNRIRQLIRFRRQHRALQADGQLEVLFLQPQQYPLIYRREHGQEQLVVALNPSPRSVVADVPGIDAERTWTVLLGSAERSRVPGGDRITMAGRSFAVWSLTREPAELTAAADPAGILDEAV